MSKRKHKASAPAASAGRAVVAPVTTVHGLAEFKREAERLRSAGYYAVPGYFGGGDGGFKPDYADYLSSKLTCDGGDGSQKGQLPLLHVSSGYAQPTETANGHKGSYITWGAGNRLPNVVSLLCSLSPYTAAALKFNIDLATGMGPRPMYRYTQFVGGNISEKTIEYDSAGTLLKGWKIDLLRQLHELERTAADGQQQDGTVTLNDRLLGGQSAEQVSEYKKALQERLAEIEADLDVWEQTQKELQEFQKNNNLLQTFQQLYSDMLQYNICFPELELQEKYIDPDTGHEVKTFKWSPKVVGLKWRNAKTLRLEQLTTQNRIEHVYISNRWLDDPALTPKSTDISALPALSAQSPSTDLERLVRETRRANAGRRSRPTHVVLPVSYNEYGHTYYPVPAWYSVFSGDVYTYASTLISDRKKRRDNANTIGKVIYLSDEYMQRMYQQRGLTSDDDKKKLFANVMADINNFLSNRDNMGKPLLAYNFTGADGKVYKSWEIVELEESSKSTAEANKEELAEISSIILFAWGVDSQLIGNTPGTTTRSGGTDLRERYLLKQVQMASLQRLVLSALDVVRSQNQWDTHLTWEVKREVLTTLDRSKTGITTAEDS